jgi:hypothetical protein
MPRRSECWRRERRLTRRWACHTTGSQRVGAPADSVKLGPASADAALSAVFGGPFASATKSSPPWRRLRSRPRRIVRPAVPLWTNLSSGRHTTRTACRCTFDKRPSPLASGSRLLGTRGERAHQRRRRARFPARSRRACPRHAARGARSDSAGLGRIDACRRPRRTWLASVATNTKRWKSHDCGATPGWITCAPAVLRHSRARPGRRSRTRSDRSAP